MGHSGVKRPVEPPQGENPRILHIFIAEKFIEPFIEFVEGNFADFDKHIFFCIGNETRHRLRRRPNILFKSGYRRVSWAYLDLVRQMYKANKIILHGLWSTWTVRLLSIQPWLLKKCFWIIWGGDLYAFKFAERNLQWHLKEIPRRIVIKRLGHLVTYVEGDVDLARKWYGARGRYHECLMYPSNLYKDYDVPPKTDNTINIQVGNSADPRNEHFEILEMLEPYKEENVKIYGMLSYGPRDHTLEVAEVGKKLFGDKFIAVTDFMPLDEYLEFLGKIDIAVFNHRRQQAMGNIITLLGMGKKVYLRKEVTHMRFLDSLGVETYAMEEFNLELLDTELAVRNRSIIRAKFSIQELVKGYKTIFE